MSQITVKVKDRMRFGLALVLTAGFFAVVGVLVFVQIPEANQRMFDILFGALTTVYIMVISYYFGDSSGSVT
jgi:hypothetical protein